VPLEELFAKAVDVSTLKEWNQVVQHRWLTSGGNVEVGTTYMVEAKMMGSTMEIPSEFV